MDTVSGLKIATIERVRWWLAVDAPLLRQVRENNRCLTADTLHRIVKFYGVRRTLGRHENSCKIASLINQAAGEWPSTLQERAESCISLAEQLSEFTSTQRAPYSAVTKLMWFRHPNSWTVFDSYAAQALGIRPGPRTGERLKRFYQELHHRGFDEAIAAVDDVLQGTIWHDINAARIIDSWLMLSGGFPFLLGDEHARNGFIEALPGDSGKVLEVLAERIASALLSTRFIQSTAG